MPGNWKCQVSALGNQIILCVSKYESGEGSKPITRRGYTVCLEQTPDLAEKYIILLRRSPDPSMPTQTDRGGVF
jgi:hypothetical protein